MPTTHQMCSKEALHKEFHKPLEGEVLKHLEIYAMKYCKVQLTIFHKFLLFSVPDGFLAYCSYKNHISFKSPNHRSCTVGRPTQTPTTFSFLDGSMIGTHVQHYLGQVQRMEQVCSVRRNVSSWWNEAC